MVRVESFASGGAAGGLTGARGYPAGPMLTIPRAPTRLRLPIDRQWNGSPSETVRASLELRIVGAALELRSELRQAGTPRIPAARPGTRVADLWEYDVVECFLAGAGGRYLELELGAGGHFLALSFRAPRVRSDEHRALVPWVDFHRGPDATLYTALRVPLAIIPGDVRAIGAFAIAGGLFLAHAPVPGPAPDFHQPDRWTAARLAP